MRVLVACECSGVVRDAFRERGHDARSCDLVECERDPRWHIQVEVIPYRTLLDVVCEEYWDLMIAHPECKYLSSSGLHWNGRVAGRAAETNKALGFVSALWNSGIERICLENPQGCINTRLPFMPKPQYIQPYQFGHDASKRTGLWLKNLPQLVIDPALYVEPRWVECNGVMRPRWANQTDSGQNRLGPSETRSAERARTYEGIAKAMAEQWV